MCYSIWPGHDVDSVSTELSSWLARLCVSLLVQEANEDSVDEDHQLLHHCSQLTHHLLAIWGDVLEVIVYLFKDMMMIGMYTRFLSLLEKCTSEVSPYSDVNAVELDPPITRKRN